MAATVGFPPMSSSSPYSATPYDMRQAEQAKVTPDLTEAERRGEVG